MYVPYRLCGLIDSVPQCTWWESKGTCCAARTGNYYISWTLWTLL